MNKILLTLTMLLLAGTANAHEWDHRYRGGYYGYRNSWIAPAIVGGVIGYELGRPRYYEPLPPLPVVIVEPQPQVVVPTPPAGYHYSSILDAGCNCYRTVLVPN